ncbi:MAG: hypothetical protein HN909_09100, partial [Phycisphaerales bacterium]|nr:hypothetical protein [Phycisphaerales bacterium]
MDEITLDKIEFPAVREIVQTFCATAVGRRLAGRIVPSAKIDTIRRWQSETAEMVDVLGAVGTAPL